MAGKLPENNIMFFSKSCLYANRIFVNYFHYKKYSVISNFSVSTLNFLSDKTIIDLAICWIDILNFDEANSKNANRQNLDCLTNGRIPNHRRGLNAWIRIILVFSFNKGAICSSIFLLPPTINSSISWEPFIKVFWYST